MPLALASARAAPGAPPAAARPAAPLGDDTSEGSGRAGASRVAGPAKIYSASWLTRPRLTVARSGTPSVAKKSIVSLYDSTMPPKL